mmetsp:Transcript_41846/g.75391  ORF Transcript_41846/g.75391 Transcript_41846/m.75391 type:complete len:375 (-) Transcript_41846:148-1272(-)|eukprot:CAMPEP_0201997556 /NCGR_PEP_ID=MMETSP0905-20130828/4489_1 /ASSEMBLY_ACC=CAM_ASM_000554 /TAXON_ID=420261 /ORGANISM="Thalassiosira antarctica, Strain CCMP982" /LENGTH=374 /DNA_ID=CAMNT_0048553263 /DNA_START=8 /DNA_END=1132 /DNA_ORIENTATION=+
MPRLTRLLLYTVSTALAASAKLASPTLPRSYIRSSLAPPAFISISAPGGRVRNYKNDHCESRSIDWLRVANVDVDITSASVADADVVDVDDDYVDRGLRFNGVGRLYANKDPTITTDIVLDRLTSATVAIIGLGGVGSWAAESLCRSGIGNLILIDLDDICISNTNRQLHATASAVGKMKIDEMKNRLLDINPKCNVTLIHDFVSVENANTLIQELCPQLTACIDAIDGMYEKTALILACVDRAIPIVTCGGAAGRMDPTQITVDDLTKVQEDRLLFQCRKLLRQEHGFTKVPMPRGGGKKKKVRKWRIPAVYSTEVQQKATVEDENTSSFRICDGALGTACFVTGTYGFLAASKVVEMIALDEFVVPKKQGKR